MIEFALTSAGGHRARFRLSPLDELLGAIQVVLGLRGHPAHRPWLAAAGDGLRRLSVRELVAVLSDSEYTCDFLSPPPEAPKIDVDQQLAQVRRTPSEQVAHELHLLRRVPAALAADPRHARELLADQLELAWQELMEPYWPQVRDVLLADITYRSAHLAEGGLNAVS